MAGVLMTMMDWRLFDQPSRTADTALVQGVLYDIPNAAKVLNKPLEAQLVLQTQRLFGE